MPMSDQIDFATLKQHVSIEQAMHMLGLHMKRSGPSFRGPCPTCRSGGERALVVTPSKSAFYCFAAKQGGDQLALVAHVRGVKVRQAAEELVSHFGNAMPSASQPP